MHLGYGATVAAACKFNNVDRPSGLSISSCGIGIQAMNLNSIFAGLLGILLLMPTSLEAASSIKSINNGSGLQKSIDSIGDNQLVYLDLTFKTSVLATSNQCNRGQFGPLAHSDSFEFQIKPFADNNHLLMTIIPGAKTRFPYNAVSCPYNSSKPTEAFIRFRGYYIALHHSVPTAVLIEFRPMNPSK